MLFTGCYKAKILLTFTYNHSRVSLSQTFTAVQVRNPRYSNNITPTSIHDFSILRIFCVFSRFDPFTLNPRPSLKFHQNQKRTVLNIKRFIKFYKKMVPFDILKKL